MIAVGYLQYIIIYLVLNEVMFMYNKVQSVMSGAKSSRCGQPALAEKSCFAQSMYL